MTLQREDWAPSGAPIILSHVLYVVSDRLIFSCLKCKTAYLFHDILAILQKNVDGALFLYLFMRDVGGSIKRQESFYHFFVHSENLQNVYSKISFNIHKSYLCL